MPKKEKEARKRALRRERAKMRAVETFAPEAAPGSDDGTVEAKAASKETLRKLSEQGGGTTSPKEEIVQEETISFSERVKEFFEPVSDFLKEVSIEARKINWPSTDETWRSTRAVIFIILFLAAFMGIFGWGFSKVAKALFASSRHFTTIEAPSHTGEQTPEGSTGVPTDSGTPAPSDSNN